MDARHPNRDPVGEERAALSEFASFAAIKVGDETRVRRRFTADAVDAFARVSGDDNPLHAE